jgi:hypothetical protein
VAGAATGPKEAHIGARWALTGQPGLLRCGAGQGLGRKYDSWRFHARYLLSTGRSRVPGGHAGGSLREFDPFMGSYQSSPKQEGVNKPIKKKPSRKTASSPAATTESAKGEGQSSTGTALDRRRFRSYSEARMAVFQFPPERTLVM